MGLDEVRGFIITTLETKKDVEVHSMPFMQEFTKDGPIKDHQLVEKLKKFSEDNGLDYVWIFPEGMYAGKAILRFWRVKGIKKLKEVEEDAVCETGQETESGCVGEGNVYDGSKS
jgi:hypothetical protein